MCIHVNEVSIYLSFQPQIEQPPVKIIKDPETQEAVEPDQNVLTQLLKYSFKYPPRVEHDFTKSRYVTYYSTICTPIFM